MASSRTQRRGFIWWMAWRNFSLRRHGSGLSFMTSVSILGVAVGVAALIIVLSVMGGFEADLRRKMLAGQPHLEVLSEFATGGFSLVDYPLSAFKELYPEATGIEPFTTADVVLKRKSFLASATLFGIDPALEGKLWGFHGDAFYEGRLADLSRPHRVIESDLSSGPERPGIMLGDQLAQQLGADIGDEVTVLSPQANVGAVLGGGTISRSYVVAGKFSTGMFNYDAKWSIVTLGEGRRFLPDYDESLEREQYVTGVGINFKDPMAVATYEARVEGRGADPGDNILFEKFAGLPAEQRPVALSGLTWQETNKSLLFALKLEKFAMGSILMLIVVVAAFSISGTMMMTVFHKRGQVALLRALGMSRSQIARLFMAHGMTIGTVGIALGLAIGVAACLLIAWGRVVPLPPGIYYLKMLPVRFLPVDYVVICVSAWFLSLAAAVWPALTAARQEPSLGLRYE